MTDESLIQTERVIDILGLVVADTLDFERLSTECAAVVNGPNQALQMANAVTAATAALIKADVDSYRPKFGHDQDEPRMFIQTFGTAPSESPHMCATQMLTAVVNGDKEDALSLATPAIVDGSEETGIALVAAILLLFRSVYFSIEAKRH